jgi:subfamily B ATP-binding cassette protein MsbA
VRFGGAIFLISRYNLKLTIVSLVILPLFFEVARRSRGAIRMSSIEAMEKGAKVRGKIQETLSGIEVVKTYAKEGYEAAEIKTGLRNMIELEIIQNLFSSLSGKILGVLTSVNLLVILWVGGHEIMAGRLTVGQYVAFVAYIGYLYGPIQMFALTFLQFQRAFMACKRISDFMDKTAEDECPERINEYSAFKGDITFENVSYRYDSGNNVLHNITFSIRAGKKIAFVGKSGAGKSTLVHLILGLYTPTVGRIEIDGIDVKTVRLESLRKRIGIVSQNIFLFDDSILNNIKYSRPDASMEEVISAARSSGCHEFISRLPEGYKTNAGEIGKKLSGGEKQRISIARCLLKKPDLIIFDEPTAHLDSVAVKNLTASIRNLFLNKTCIIISHHLVNISWVDRIFVLEEGRLVQEGTHADLVKKAGEYRELFETNSLGDSDFIF